MSCDDESGNSIPYIDDLTTCGDDESVQDRCGHSVSITENYRHHRNRSSGPVAPLAEIDFANDTPDDEPRPPRTAKDSVVRLVIKGWNSTVSIQGFDNKSSITFKRKSDRRRQEKDVHQTRNETGTESHDGKKSKKKRWKMLTKSLMAKSGRHDRRGLDERYPKYVLLKDEDEEEEAAKTKEKQKEDKRRVSAITEDAYPKMVVVGERRGRLLKGEPIQIDREKSPFHIKRTFKNKTNPLHVTDQTCPTQKQDKETPTKRKDEDEGVKTKHRLSEGRKKPKVTTERQQVRAKSTEPLRRRGSVAAATACRGIRPSSSHDNVFNEIQGVLKEALHLSPDGSAHQKQPDLCRPATCRFCDVINQPYRYASSTSSHSYRPTCDPDLPPETPRQLPDDGQDNLHGDDLQNIQIGILSTFFPPPVMIMKTYPNDYPELEGCPDDKSHQVPEDGGQSDANIKSPTLVVSVPDFQIKSKPFPEEDKFQTSLLDSVSEKTSPEGSNNVDDEGDGKTRTDETETTKYLRYDDCKKVVDNDESPTTTTCTLKTDEENKETTRDLEKPTDGNPNLSLTEIGYKMYDNLTRLSLVREKEEEPEPEADCPTGSRSPCNITLESEDSVIRIFVPENKFNFRILQGDGTRPDIRIGLSGCSGADSAQPSPEKIDCRKVVKRSELWHLNGDRPKGSGLAVSTPKGVQGSKINVAIADEKEVFLSIERRDKEGKICGQKLTKDINVGTDDFEATGNDEMSCPSDGHFKNLSPRKGRLLRNLKDKLEERGRMINHRSSVPPQVTTTTAAAAAAAAASAAKAIAKPDRPDEIFLVRQISSGSELAGKPLEVSSLQRTSCKGPENDRLREYYCEDCFATMRIFQDENPSVKSMVNKFETIIQLESF